VASEERIGSKELLNERIFLGLRSDGLDLGGIRAEFALDLSPSGNETVRRLVDESLAVIDGEVLRLTPKGYLICDEVAGHLMI
jgi:coproporphyrinogen III oxidase-like Fe-S oxidoreductase